MGSCPSGELSEWRVVLVVSCPSGELSEWRVVLVGVVLVVSCPSESCPSGLS